MAAVFRDERFGRSNILSSFDNIYCSIGDEYENEIHTDVDDCYTNTKWSDCYISKYACQIEYGLRCYSK